MVQLPENFINRMAILLEHDYPAFLKSYSTVSKKGIRLNPLKCTIDVLRKNIPFTLTSSPFSPLSYYVNEEGIKIGLLPMHHAGAFYSQEPSAASAVTVLDPKPGDRVLDLCAAPGGKSTQIAGLLMGKGLLWSNEMVKKRSKILLSNMERCGVRNAVVSCCYPDVLCHRLAGFFDKVLVDAPCSGEGMFRRDKQAIQDWSVEHVRTCAVRQSAILDLACEAVAQNGILDWKPSKEENEDVVTAFLERHPEFIPEDCGVSFGRSGIGMPWARRIYPMDGGDGHFVAKFRRVKENEQTCLMYQITAKQDISMAKKLYDSIIKESWQHNIVKIKEQFLLLPPKLPQLDGLGVLRAGVLLGESKTNRVEPAHGLFMATTANQLHQVISFDNDNPCLFQFLRGEEIAVPNHIKGYAGVAVDGIVTGFGKCSAGKLKNHYPKGLRNF